MHSSSKSVSMRTEVYNLLGKYVVENSGDAEQLAEELNKLKSLFSVYYLDYKVRINKLRTHIENNYNEDKYLLAVEILESNIYFMESPISVSFTTRLLELVNSLNTPLSKEESSERIGCAIVLSDLLNCTFLLNFENELVCIENIVYSKNLEVY